MTLFEFFEPEGKILPSKIKSLISFTHSKWVESLIISFNSGVASTKMDLFGRKNNTSVIDLYWQNFNNQELLELSSVFGFDLRQSVHTRDTSNLASSIIGAEPIGQAFAKIAFKPAVLADQYYVAVFDYEFPDKTFDGMIYVHGIWLVRLESNIRIKFAEIIN